MDIIDRINGDLAASMKSRTEELRVSTLRMMKSAIKNAEIAKRGRGDLLEEDVLAVLSAMVKQRRDSEEQYRQGNRPELADKEKGEIEIIQEYLPRQLAVEEIDGLIREAMEKSGASGLKDMGRLMKELMPLLKGRADGKTVNLRVRELLEQAGR